jgi:pantothenate synthetase
VLRCAARRSKADILVASIYVNPTQFAAHEDFDVYPRNAVGTVTLDLRSCSHRALAHPSRLVPQEADRAKLKSAGCHAVFEPESLYAKGEAAHMHAASSTVRKLDREPSQAASLKAVSVDAQCRAVARAPTWSAGKQRTPTATRPSLW